MEPQAFVDEVSAQFRALSALMDLSNDDFIRTTEHAAQARLPGAMAAAAGVGRHLPRPLRGLVRRPRRGVLRRGRADVRPGRHQGGAHRGAGGVGAGTELLLPPVRLAGPAAGAIRADPDFIQPGSRRNEVISFVRGGLHDLVGQPHQLHLGRAGAGRPGACDVCVAGRADQLHHRRAASRTRRRPAGRSGRRTCMWSARTSSASMRCIWPAFLMAAGLPVPRTGVRPWLVDGGRREDEQVARQRHRRRPAGRDLRARPGALLPAAGGAVRQ